MSTNQGRLAATASRPLLIGLAIVAAASLLANLMFLWHGVQGPPFVLIMKPAAGGGATVQFIQPQDRGNRTSASPEFHVDVELQAPFITSLNSPHVAIPGAVVELGDVTVLPGAFHLRFGDEVFHVMESRIHLRGMDYEWQTTDGATPVADGGTENADGA